MNTSKIRAVVTSRRFGTFAAVSVVAAIAGYASYGHQRDVALMAHQAAELAAVLPLSVDGMLAAAAIAIGEDKAEGRKPRIWAVVAFWLGAIVSIAANVSSVFIHWGFDPLAIAVSAWPPVAFLFTIEILTRKGKMAKPEKNPNRVEGGRRAAAKRTATKTTTRKPRAPKAPANTAQANAMLAAAGVAPKSPAPAGA
jgi:hypothetical protein